MYFGRLSPSFSRNSQVPTMPIGLATCNGADHPRYSLDLAAKEAPDWQTICSRRRRRRKQAVTSWLQTLDTDFPTPGSLIYTICYPYSMYSLHPSQNNFHLIEVSIPLFFETFGIMLKYKRLCSVLPYLYDVACLH